LSGPVIKERINFAHWALSIHVLAAAGLSLRMMWFFPEGYVPCLFALGSLFCFFYGGVWTQAAGGRPSVLGSLLMLLTYVLLATGAYVVSWWMGSLAIALGVWWTVAITALVVHLGVKHVRSIAEQAAYTDWFARIGEKP